MGLLQIGPLVTQAVAFLIVFWVLKRYAWGPILGAIDARRDQIEAQLKRAEDIEKQAEAHQAEYAAKLREIDAESRERLNKSIEEARKIAESIQQTARQEARHIIEQGKRNVQLELEKAQTVLEERSVELVIEISERLIKEKLDDEHHRRLVMEFVSQAAARN